MSAEGVTIGLLGSFELCVDGALVELPQQQARIVLASLALEAGHPVPVDPLAERLVG